jgi:hypothetical protein
VVIIYVYVRFVLPCVLLLVALMCRAGGKGRLRRNSFAGIRIRSTMASDEGWRAGHAAAVVPSWIGFVAAALVVGVSFALPDSEPVVVAILVIETAIFLATVTSTLVFAGSAARGVDAR